MIANRRSEFKLDWLILPLLGAVFVLLLWQIASTMWSKDLPGPLRTWNASKPYLVKPFEKRGELDQGILRFAWYSLLLVAKGYAIALLIGTPIGFMLGLSKFFAKSFDPIDRKSTRLNSSHSQISYAVFCLTT